MSAAAQNEGYEKGVLFPRPTSQQYDSLRDIGALPIWLSDERYLPFYWPRSDLSAVVRGSYRTYAGEALRGGPGVELNLAVPLLQADYGVFLSARANRFTMMNSVPGWDGTIGNEGTLYNLGLGVAFGLPYRSPLLSSPMMLSLGAASFTQEGGGISAGYITVEPGFGLRYRLGQKFVLQTTVQPTWFIPTRGRDEGIFSWNFSFGLEVVLSVDRNLPLQRWVPPLVLGAKDVVQLLMKEPPSPLSWLDRNLDVINTELKPLSAFRWYDLGHRGIVRGTVVASSRASTGNITAIDIRIDSADQRGFRVWRTALLLDSTRAMKYLLTRKRTGAGETSPTLQQIVDERIKQGEYAFRPKDGLGVRYLRSELFPEAKGPLDQIPKVGSRVEIAGNLMWDGDGHLEIHPRRPQDVRLIQGEFLDSDDEASLE